MGGPRAPEVGTGNYVADGIAADAAVSAATAQKRLPTTSVHMMSHRTEYARRTNNFHDVVKNRVLETIIWETLRAQRGAASLGHLSITWVDV